MLIEEAGGLDHLEMLQNHASQKIYEMAFKMVDKYFQGEEEVCYFNVHLSCGKFKLIFEIAI